MLKKLRSPVGCLLLGMILFLGGTVYVYLQVLRLKAQPPTPPEPFLAEVLLPNQGNRLRLVKTQSGPFDYERTPVRKGLLNYSMEPPLSLHLPGIDPDLNVPGQTFLFRTVDAQGQYTMLFVPQLRSFQFVESTGFVFKATSAQGFMAGYDQLGSIAFTRSALPRRDKQLRIQIVDMQFPTAQPLEMTIPNPCYRESFPVWQAEPFPIEKTRGPITLRMESVRFSINHVSPRWQITSSDPDWAAATLDVSLEDATGNRGAILSPFEPVWKVIAKAYRSPRSTFPAEVSTRLDKIPVLAPGLISPLRKEIRLGGNKYRVICVAGAGAVQERGTQFVSRIPSRMTPAGMPGFTKGTASEGFFQVEFQAPFLWIDELETSSDGAKLVIQYDRDGQVVDCPQMPGRIEQRTMILVKLPAQLTEVDLTFSLSQPEEFEFFVTPPEEARAALVTPPAAK